MVNFNIVHVNYICISIHLCSHCRVFNYASKREECVFYTLKLLKSIFIVVGYIKEANVGEEFPHRADRTTLICSPFKVPQVQSEALIIYQIIHSLDSINWHDCHFYFCRCLFIFDNVKRSSSLASWGRVLCHVSFVYSLMIYSTLNRFSNFVQMLCKRT